MDLTLTLGLFNILTAIAISNAVTIVSGFTVASLLVMAGVAILMSNDDGGRDE